jgi:hypothetical protein
MTEPQINRDGVVGTPEEWDAFQARNWETHSTQPLWLGVLAVALLAAYVLAMMRRRKKSAAQNRV